MTSQMRMSRTCNGAAVTIGVIGAVTIAAIGIAAAGKLRFDRQTPA